MIHLVIPGKVQAWQRRATKGGWSYTPTETRNYKTMIVVMFRHDYPGFVPLEGPIVSLVKIYKPIPRSASKKKQAAMRDELIRPIIVPDYDNYAKIVGDALNQVAYGDDKQIVTGTVEKWYSDQPRLEIDIERWIPRVKGEGDG